MPHLLLVETSMVALAALGVIALIILIIIMVFFGTYNGLVTLRNNYQNAYAQIDVQAKRRYDLIPNLVETAKGYMAHERQTLEGVTQARNMAITANAAAAAKPGDPASMQQVSTAEGALSGSLSRLLAVAESYPDLKANANMMQLMEELTSTENKMGYARQGFNDSVTTYNNAVQTFPGVVIAGMFAFVPAHLYQIEDAAQREAPKVSFS
jgi:LemA protein